MTTQQQKIGGYTGANVPGVLNLYLIDTKEVLSVLDPVRHRIPGASMTTIAAGGILLSRGAMITRMKFPPLACSYIQTIERTDGGLISKVQIEFSMPASRQDILAFYMENWQKRFVGLIEDANRLAYVVGNEERGLMMQIGQTVNSINANTVSLAGNFATPAFLLEASPAGLVLADHFRDTDFGIDFSLDFNA